MTAPDPPPVDPLVQVAIEIGARAIGMTNRSATDVLVIFSIALGRMAAYLVERDLVEGKDGAVLTPDVIIDMVAADAKDEAFAIGAMPTDRRM